METAKMPPEMLVTAHRAGRGHDGSGGRHLHKRWGAVIAESPRRALSYLCRARNGGAFPPAGHAVRDEYWLHTIQAATA